MFYMMGAFSPNRAFNLSQNLFRFRTQSITLRDEVDDEIFEHAWQLVVRHQPDANFWFVELLDDRAFTVWDVWQSGISGRGKAISDRLPSSLQVLVGIQHHPKRAQTRFHLPYFDALEKRLNAATLCGFH